jgi:hypothetical protein
VIAEMAKRDDEEQIEALVVPFEDIKIATLYKTVSFGSGNFAEW